MTARSGSLGAVHLLQAFALALLLVPTRLRFPLGPVGHPAKFLALCMLLAWLVAVLAWPERARTRVGPVRWLLAVWWAAMLVSYAVMNFHEVAADELANSDRMLIDFVLFAGVALFAAESITSLDEFMTVVRTTVGGAAVMAAIAIVQSRLNFDATTWIAKIPVFTTSADLTSVLNRDGYNRPAGTATHPIEFGVVLGLTLAFAIHVAIFDQVWSRRRRWITLALVSFGLPIAISRSAVLVGGIVLVMFLLGSTPRRRRQVLPPLMTLLVVVFMTVPGLLGTLRGYIFAGQSDSSISTRTEDYAAVSPYVRQSPWIGRGPGSFIPRLRILDNQYLLTLIEMGIVGLVVVVVLFLLPAVLGQAGRRMRTDEGERNLGQAFAAAGIGATAGAPVYDAFSFPMFTLLVALLTGLSGAYWRLSREGRPSSGWLAGDPNPAAVEPVPQAG